MSDIIFGPVSSRRFGRSLGIDLSPNKKQCNFDCLYCELAPAKTQKKQDSVVALQEVIEALHKALSKHKDIDVITLTANGEPTLYPHLGPLVTHLKTLPYKTLILSNSATLTDPKIANTLLTIDTVKLSLDCVSAKCFKKLDRIHPSIDTDAMIDAMREFARKFQNTLVIEILFVKDINDNQSEIKALNEILLQIKPSRIDIGTIDRPPAYNVKGLSYHELASISKLFDPSLNISIATRKKAAIYQEYYSKNEIRNTLAKRPLTDDDLHALFDHASMQNLQQLLQSGDITKTVINGLDFYKAP